jgi:hypothetical protein
MIRRILFGTLRKFCADLGVYEGDIVSCRAGTSTHLVLRTAAGRTIPLDREWTRFIQISEPAGPSPQRTVDEDRAVVGGSGQDRTALL